MTAMLIETHIFLKLGEGFPNSFLREDHSVAVRPAVSRRLQALSDGGVEQRGGGSSVDAAAGHRGDVRRPFHVQGTGPRDMDLMYIVV